ncbi:MAG: GIY-YIG nuclease family protein [Pseudoalteromonas prydzensis]|uniref:GIY-YIG nuclease family protein n=2 Tax=root TaxID=1 RepID=A0A7V1CWC3_9GAMM|nr:GIY-YIG nuclease family protein [Pseudoalteromonas prydzensis]HEA15419.1 GIY-YIG nuclease family protein [Pseudoalteromonas prydzensis]
MTSQSAKSLTNPENSTLINPAIWSLYIVQTRLGHWYTGISPDVAKRFAAHQAGKGAKNLKGKGPLILIYQCEVGSRSEATKLEIKIKQLSKAQKRVFVATGQQPKVLSYPADQ